MPKFSKRSIEHLCKADHHLRILFEEVIKKIDCAVVSSFRTPKEQETLYRNGKSLAMPGKSKHERYPSQALDVVPCVNGKVSWEDHDCYLFAGKVMGYVNAMNMEHRIRCGADWNGNGSTRDQELHDPCHFEMIEA